MAEQNKAVMEEEKQSMEDDIKKWELNFAQQNGRQPEEQDK